MGTDDEQKHPEAQAQHSSGTERCVLQTLRAVHTSSAVKPVLDQMVIPASDGEANTFVPFMGNLLDAYGKTGLVECVTVDAGFTSRFNMHWLQDRDSKTATSASSQRSRVKGRPARMGEN